MTALQLVQGALTPELLDLMEHEKVIEQGMHTFVDVGYALLAIRDGRKYKAAGYRSFEAYCRERWQMGRRYADYLIAATDETENRGARNERDARRRRGANKARPHPATFSDAILRKIAPHIEGVRLVVDPFAGIGRVHELRRLANVEHTIGVEIEPEWANLHPDTICGDSQRLLTLVKARDVDAIVTSPTYGNRMADHHDARDDSTRHTYRHTLGRELDDENSGAMQWGDAYRALHRRVWKAAVKLLRDDGGVFVLNIKNHVRNGSIVRVAEWHINELIGLGLTIEAIDAVNTTGMLTGEHADEKVDHELIVSLIKSS